MSTILTFQDMLPLGEIANKNLDKIIQQTTLASMEQIKPQNNTLVINSFNNIPNKLNSPLDMPMQTSLWCWNCSLPFTTRPVYLPMSKITDRDGVFCTFSCCTRYTDTITDENLRTDLRKNLFNLVKIYYPNRGNYILIAASKKTDMIHYGGHKTVEQYKKEVIQNDINMFLVCEKQAS